jgi:hypothetical protein
MVKYYFNDQKQFCIEDYDSAKPFASFLPGVAGIDGIPMWVYYVNRGQAISSFGIENKDNPILDFTPANLSYRRTEVDGFRTFIKVDGVFHECFTSRNDQVNKTMKIETNSITLEEKNLELQFKVIVKFFNVAKDDYPGLIRKVEFINLSNKPRHIEVVDGLATLWPYGTSQFSIKNMANLAVAWFDVFNMDQQLPFYRNRSTTEDTAIVGAIEAGHFYGSFSKSGVKLPIIYDLNLIFGYNTSLLDPQAFKTKRINEILKEEQVSVNQLLGAFSCFEMELKDSETVYSVVGKMADVHTLNEKAKTFNYHYFENMETIAQELGNSLSSSVEGTTNYPVFDAYIKQSFVDNLLRGGYPIIFKGKTGPIVYHVFSRIHGDMEREYNNFYVEPAFFSHGNGSYRDVNQNRRNDVYFVKEAGIFNIKQFMDLIQLDGQNPLTIKGSTLLFDAKYSHQIMKHVLDKKEVIESILSNRFTPGKLLTSIKNQKIQLSVDPMNFLEEVMSFSTQETESSFGTGYWSDHWTYNMDLIDNYLNVFPDQHHSLLFDGKYRFFQSHMTVLPRSQKYVQMDDGKVRQLEPIIYDHEKVKVCKLDPNGTNWQKNDQRNIVEVDLFTKLFHLALMKFVTLDPAGLGVMMDADKPGWNDSMNGLPGIFGSGLSETVELGRILAFVQEAISSYPEQEIELPSDIFQLFEIVSKIVLNPTIEEVALFNEVQSAREIYRVKTNHFLNSAMNPVKLSNLSLGIDAFVEKVFDGINRAIDFGHGILPTYLTFTAEDYEVIDGSFHPHLKLPNVAVKRWSFRALPSYLEAPARYLKQCRCITEAKTLYKRIKDSEMYDKKLKMYITSTSLEEETLEIGRARAFTKGWLEREANFMHMSYKYLIGLLKSGLYKEYFEDFKTSIPPFMDPTVYGRSLLENSSFIASSNNPNPNNHGRGFVARLTGTTSEALTMYLMMISGKHLFSLHEGKLSFQIYPILTSDFFDSKNQVHFKLFNTISVTVNNHKRKNTFGKDSVKAVEYILTDQKGNQTTIHEQSIVGEVAKQIRDGFYQTILVNLN